MATARNIIKQWFSNFKKPTQEQFWAWIDSFWHKDDKIPMSSVQHLEQSLQNVVTSDQFGNHLEDDQAHAVLLAQKVDKEEGKGLSTNDFTTALKQKLESLEHTDLTDYATKNLVQEVKTDVENLKILLQSDNSDLDSLQEIVNFIMLNKATLSTLGIDNIAGLQQALSQKADINHNHDQRYYKKTEVNTLLTQKANADHIHSYNDLTDRPDFAVTQDITRALAVHLAGISNNSISYSVDGKDAGKTIFLNHPSNVLIEDFEGLTACFKKCYDGATGTSFYSPNYPMVHNGGTQLDGKKGSNAVVSVNKGICYVDYCNY